MPISFPIDRYGLLFLISWHPTYFFPFSKERVVSEELFDVRGRLTAETSKAASLSTEKTLLKTELETLKMKLTAAEEAKSAQVQIRIM